jgi:hypothetical protein
MKNRVSKFQPFLRPFLLGTTLLTSLVCQGQLTSFSSVYPATGGHDTKIYGVVKTLNNKLLTVGVQTTAAGLQGGTYPGYLSQYHDMRLLQTDLDGNVMFNRIVSSPYDDRAFDAVRANLGDMLVVGHSGQGYTMADRRAMGLAPNLLNAAVAVVRINPAGTVVSQRHYDLGGFDDHAFSIVRKANESYYILGRSYRNPYDKYVITFMNTNSNGAMQSASIIHDNYASNLLPRKMIRTSDGGYLIAAVKDVQDGAIAHSPDPMTWACEGSGILLIKLDVNENIVFSRFVAPATTGGYLMGVRDLVEDQYDNVFIVGTSSEGDYIMKMNAAGTITRAKTFVNAPGLMDITPFCIARNGSTLVVSGYSGNVGVPRVVFDANLNVIGAQSHDFGDETFTIENVSGGLQYYGGQGTHAMLLKMTNGLPICRGDLDSVAVVDFPYTQQLLTLYKQSTPYYELDNLADSLKTTNRQNNCIVSTKTDGSAAATSSTMSTPSFYPNPAHDRIQLDLPGQGSSDVQLLDLQGRLLLRRSLPAGQHDLPVADLESGVYLLRIQSAAGLHTHKLRIQH